MQKHKKSDSPKQTWKKTKPNAEKMTKQMTKISIQQPSEFAGKIFIMVVFGNVFGNELGNVLSSMGQSLSTRGYQHK